MGFELTTSQSLVPYSANCAREESVEYDFTKALMIHTHNQIVTSNRELAQLAEYLTVDPEVMSSNPSGDNF